ncbi:MAG: hypothetical protein ACKPKO_34900, partial [Candidatus Fonsibacter sp.]
MNTRAGDLLTVKFKYAKPWGGGNVYEDRMADLMHNVLHSDQIMEIHDTGVRVFDYFYNIFCYYIITRVMPVSLTNSKDMVANSISVIDYNNVVNIMDLIGQVNHIITVIVCNPPLTMNTLENISQAINNDPQFYNVIINMISRLLSTTIANYYTKAEVQQ